VSKVTIEGNGAYKRCFQSRVIRLSDEWKIKKEAEKRDKCDSEVLNMNE
jgi:hypothetical protein